MNITSHGITRFYTKQEVAQILRVSVRTITRYMGDGLPYKKIRGTVRIPEDKFLEWVNEEGKTVGTICSQDCLKCCG